MIIWDQTNIRICTLTESFEKENIYKQHAYIYDGVILGTKKRCFRQKALPCNPQSLTHETLSVKDLDRISLYKWEK